jgi:2-polyprenyl-6-methoxyphenol hydroxylase-like FAD-dependent oxidoreductase
MAHRHASADVIVVGARAAGAATALLLARAGLSVLVVDRAAPGADTLSTHALMRGAVLQLSRWGLLDELVDAGTPPIRRTTFRYSDSDVAVTIKPSPGVDALYAPRRTVLDPVLARAASAAGATVRYGVTVMGLLRDGGRVSGIVARDADGRRFTATAPLVVGADGRGSAVARAVDAPCTHRARNAAGVLYGYWSGLTADGYEWAYRPGAAAGLIPTNDGQTCVFAAATPKRVGRGGRAELESIVAAASPDLGARVRAAGAPTALRAFPGLPGYLRRPWGPGWALVGDAGSWKDPISAHGLTDALRDAELLALAAATALGGTASEPVALAAYEAERDRLTLPILTAADEIAAFAWDDTRIIELLGMLNRAMADELQAIEALDLPETPLLATSA